MANFSDLRQQRSEARFFERMGWLGSYPLLSSDHCALLCEAYFKRKHEFVEPKDMAKLTATDAFDNVLWFKSLHAEIPEVRDVARSSTIMSHITPLLGDDVVCWGSSITTAAPGRRHRWHVDVEHRRWKGLTAFIGLLGISKGSSLKVLDGSHKLSYIPQELKVFSDEDSLAAGRSLGLSGHVTSVSLEPGEFFIFDGSTWHGSYNVTSVTRYALVLQYTTPENLVSVPLNWDEPIIWNDCSPPCMLVSGCDNFSRNKLI